MCFKRFTFNRWQVAYRLKNDAFFTLLPNPKWGWAADPFPIIYQDSLYIFAEIYLYKSERNGVIAYNKFENGRFTGWVVSMDRHWHISYPNVFVQNDRLYMCPETYQNDEIAIYELIGFPDQWKKIKVLKSNLRCVDTTFCEYQGKTYMFTFQVEKGVKGKLCLYQINQGKATFIDVISEDIGSARPGGRIIYHDGKLFRVSQNGLREYGGGLVFSEIDSMSPVYKEHEIRRVSAEDICGNWRQKFVGIHTYNKIEAIETIDLKYHKISLLEFLARKRVRKVFMNKY